MSDVTLSPAISASMESLGISPSLLDADEITDVEATSTEAEAETNESLEGEGTEAEGEEVATEEATDSAEVKTEGEETKEAPIEEPKLTAKEFQELAAAREQIELEKKAFNEERQKVERELTEKYHEKVKLHDELDAYFVDLEAKDPDLYALVQSSFRDHQRQYNNPVLAKQREQIDSIRAELDQFKNAASAEVTLAKLEADSRKLTESLGKEAEAAGIKMDIQKVKEIWSKNPNLSLEEAAWVTYGPSLMKASASKAKVQAVENKIQGRPAVKTAGAVNRSASPVTEKVPTSAYDAVRYFAKQITGKA